MRAAFTRVQRDARHVPERVGERADALLPDHLRRNDVDGLRRVENLLGEKVEIAARFADDDGFDCSAVRCVEGKVFALGAGDAGNGSKSDAGKAERRTHERLARLGGIHTFCPW